MTRPASDKLQRRVEREAETSGVEIEAVRVVPDDDVEGTVIRILHKDADNEADQVGIQVVKPNTELGDQMFQNRLSDSLSELRRYVRGSSETTTADSESETSTVDDTEVETPSVTETENQPQTEQTTAPTIESSITLGVQIDDNSLEDVQDELRGVFEEYEAVTASETRADALEERIDSLDARLESIEEKLSLLGGD